MITHIICFYGEIRTGFIWLPVLSEAMEMQGLAFTAFTFYKY